MPMALITVNEHANLVRACENLPMPMPMPMPMAIAEGVMTPHGARDRDLRYWFQTQ